MSRILCIALNPTVDIASDVDKLVPTRKMRTRNQRQDAGGGGINVARVLAELGEHPDLIYFSGGATGNVLEDALKGMSVTLRPVPMSGAVRVAFMVQEISTGLEYRFVPEGPVISEREVEVMFETLEASTADYVVASGSLPRGAPTNTYARMAQLFLRKGSRFVLDASGEALKETLSETQVYLVKPSLDELEYVVGHSLDEVQAAEAAQMIVRRGAAKYMVVTMGQAGALVASADKVIKEPALAVPVRSSVGAGDSFTGAMVWALAQNYPLDEAFRLGIAAGAAAVTTQGSEFSRQQVFDLYHSMSTPM
ncbi:1-phosphofructokinase family hexose kinase [Neorhizobium sp. Rsf11]|uniref:Phosphofructokinase n=1 Tax=Neorhizobium phenanthreniclasticum TaxID=3157917 RepID=A0ABV0M519_9HYPH